MARSIVTRLLTTTSVAALLVSPLATSGCSQLKDAVKQAESPKQKLLDAAPDGSSGTFRFTMTEADGTFTGAVDPATNGMEIDTVQKVDATTKLKLDFLVYDKTIYIRLAFTRPLPGLTLPKSWTKLDPAKLTDKSIVNELTGTGDPANIGPLVDAAATVTAGAKGSYSGTIDLTKSNVAGVVLTPAETTALGAAAKAIPFTATVDDKNRVTGFAMNIPAVGKRKAEVQSATYQYLPLTLPSVKDAPPTPASVYKLMNG